MINKPAISVVIPTYDRPNWLKQAIESALCQTYMPVEVIVVDDGSTEIETRMIASQYPKVLYLFQSNQGLGAARNTGIDASHGEFIQFLDDDDWLTEDSLLCKLERFDSGLSIGVVYSDLYLTDAYGLIKGRYYSDRSRPLPSGDIYTALLRHNFIPIHAMLWRRSVLERVGGFPCWSGSEDWETVVRAAEFTQFGYVDEPLGFYRLHDQNLTLRLGSQVQGDGAVQQYIAGSVRFYQISGSERARLLSSYGLEQWLEGDPELGRSFYRMARQCNAFHPFPWLLKGIMLIGKPIGRYLMHLLWNLRFRFKKPTAAGYFLSKAGKNIESHD
jgi:glycosyltransferase involved in cell wall biosynthesis